MVLLSFSIFVGIVCVAELVWCFLMPKKAFDEAAQFEPFTAIVLSIFFLWIGEFGWRYFWNPPEHHELPIVYLLDQCVRFVMALFFVAGGVSFLLFLIAIPLGIKVRDAFKSIRR